MRVKAKKRATIYLLLVVGLVAALLFMTGRRIEPILRAVATSQSKIICTKVINEAVLSVLENSDYDYAKLVNVLIDDDGRVTSLSANTLLINRLDSELTLRINSALDTIRTADVGVPLGTLLGWEFISGRGPEIVLKMSPSAFVESRITSSFESSGINQTRHLINVEYTVKLNAIISPYTFSMTVPSSICIAETIIVGAVPDMFADFTI